MTTLNEYVAKLRSEGHRSFTVTRVAHDLGLSENAVRTRCKRLKDKGEILSPVKGLYVIIPPEYRRMGAPPPEELIPLVMKHLGLEYYVCLLSAALYHGASHQKPQIFQIMLNHRARGINAGKTQIELIYKKSLDNLPLQQIEAKTGYLKLATPELTTMDLLLYPAHCGGLNNIATILSELTEKVDVDKLLWLASTVKQKIWIQRLGYILEQIDPVDSEHTEILVTRLYHYLEDKKMSYIPLSPEVSIKGSPRNKKWKVIVNTTVEADE